MDRWIIYRPGVADFQEEMKKILTFCRPLTGAKSDTDGLGGFDAFNARATGRPDGAMIKRSSKRAVRTRIDRAGTTLEFAKTQGESLNHIYELEQLSPPP
jgi:hypothetical protein